MRYEDNLGNPEEYHPPFLADVFDARTLLDMEAALDKACKRLPAEQDTHQNRTLVANEIIAGTRQGRNDADGMNKVALAAVARFSAAKRPT